MNIAFVSWHCCARVIKFGIALMRAGHEVHFIQNRVSNNDYIKFFHSASFFENKHQFVIKMQGLKDIDLIHVHNEPSWMGWMAKTVRPDLPVVFDIHDLTHPRLGEANNDEILSIGACDGFLVPSIGYLNFVKNYFYLADKSIEVLYSYCVKNVIGLPRRPRVNGIVFEGGLSVTSDEDAQNNKFSFRDYRQVAKTLTAMDIPFIIYSADSKDIEPYTQTGALCMPYTPYFSMMKELTRYDWGLCGSPFPTVALDWAMPNKLFEYIAAGLPVIVYNGQEMGEFVEKYELGVVIKDLGEIPKIYHLHEKYRENVRKKRHRWIMEKQIPKLIEFYEKVL